VSAAAKSVATVLQVHPHYGRWEDVGGAETSVLAHLLYLKLSVYQDRLGTKVGKVGRKKQNVASAGLVSDGATKRHHFLSFPYGCPEPVLVK
jgi:hypothetical protein